MARTTTRPVATREVRLDSKRRRCEACGTRTRADWRSRRCVTTLTGCVGLSVQVRVCHREGCLLEGVPLRAEGEGRWVLPEHEFGLDVLAFIGAQRYLARPLLPGGEQELVPLLEEVKRALGRVPIVGVVSDGQRSIRNALAHALPQVPHQLCHFSLPA